MTIYECFQEYKLREDATNITSGQFKRACGYFKYVFDKRTEKYIINYKEELQPGGTYTVRDYLESYKPFIMDVIEKIHRSNLKKVPEKIEIKEEVKPVKKRVRKLVIKPVFSAKLKTNTL